MHDINYNLTGYALYINSINYELFQSFMLQEVISFFVVNSIRVLFFKKEKSLFSSWGMCFTQGSRTLFAKTAYLVHHEKYKAPITFLLDLMNFVNIYIIICATIQIYNMTKYQIVGLHQE